MKKNVLQSIGLALPAGAITLVILSGISGCSIHADPGLTPQSQSSASSETTTVTPQDNSDPASSGIARMERRELGRYWPIAGVSRGVSGTSPL
jgi:hypothetical protein